MNDEELLLGRLVDELEGDSDIQDEVNEESLKLYDEARLIRCIKHHVSNATINYYLDNIEEDNEDYWARILNEMARHYQLNPLKMFVSQSFRISNYIEHVKKLLKYIKTNVMNMFIEGIINEETDRNSFEEILEGDDDAPLLMKWVIKFIDKESYIKFISILVSEYDEELIEL